MNINLLLFLFLFVPGTLCAGERETKDSLSYNYNDKTTQFHLRQLILPVSLVAVGSWGISNNFIQSLNHRVKNNISDIQRIPMSHSDDYMQYFPVIFNIGLGLTGVPAKHTFQERLIITATSYLTMGILVNGIKRTVNEKRPDSSAHNSFPSGHTATAFMGAELVRIEYGVEYGIGAYVIACSVGLLRLYNNRHWLNDVVAGAGIGILSARVGYWLLPVNRKLFKLNKKKSVTIATVPFYDYENRALGGALSIRF